MYAHHYSNSSNTIMAPTTKNWDDPSEEERKPDPHDSALSVGTNPMADAAKYRELEEELHTMTEKVASACKCFLFSSSYTFTLFWQTGNTIKLTTHSPFSPNSTTLRRL